MWRSVRAPYLGEALQSALFILLRHRSNIAGSVDLACGELAGLARRVEALERRADPAT